MKNFGLKTEKSLVLTENWAGKHTMTVLVTFTWADTPQPYTRNFLCYSIECFTIYQNTVLILCKTSNSITMQYLDQNFFSFRSLWARYVSNEVILHYLLFIIKLLRPSLVSKFLAPIQCHTILTGLNILIPQHGHSNTNLWCPTRVTNFQWTSTTWYSGYCYPWLFQFRYCIDNDYI